MIDNKKNNNIKSKMSGNSKRSYNSVKSNKKRFDTNIKNDDIILSNNKKHSEKNNKSNGTLLSKYRFNLIEVIIIMIVTVLFGLFIGGIIAYTKPKEKEIYYEKVDDNKFVNVYNDIVNEYNGDVDKEKLMEAAIKGMLSSLNDPHSVFMNKEEAKNYNDELNGSFFGIGVEVISENNSLPIITNVYTDGPAFKAGVLSGDIIYKVDGKDLTGLLLDEITYLIKDDSKKTVNLTLVRNGSEVILDVEKDSVEIKTVSSYFASNNDKNVGVIVISSFSKNTLKQFKKEYASLKENDNIQALIVDVRNNSGGYLSAARDISSLFLNSGDVVYQKVVEGKNEKIVTNLEKIIDIPVVVVVNESTASASEIFASALKENLNVPIVGSKTFGKATIQKVKEFSDGSFVKFTVQTWLTSNGSSINDVGIIPDYEIILDDNYYNSPSLENDLQIQKALSLLN